MTEGFQQRITLFNRALVIAEDSNHARRQDRDNRVEKRPALFWVVSNDAQVFGRKEYDVDVPRQLTHSYYVAVCARLISPCRVKLYIYGEQALIVNQFCIDHSVN